MKKNILLSSIVLASTLSLTVAAAVFPHSFNPNIAYAAEETGSIIQSSDFLISNNDLEAYNQAFKIPSAAIQSIKNNGGQYASDRTIDKAIDGNPNTFWETGKPNSASFKNQFEVNFKESQSFNRMTFATRQDGAKPKGFPTSFEVYVSSSANGDDYTLVGTGKPANITAKTVEFKFKEISAKRVKFVFKEAHQDWTSASEIAFYKKDQLTDAIDHVFTDKTNTKLTDSYQSEKAISELEKLLATHPLKATYKYTIKTARDFLENPELALQYANDIFTLEQLGDPRYDAWSQKQQAMQLGSLLPTGLFYKPGENFILDVDIAEGDPLPVLVFDQNWDIKGPRSTSHTLKRGINIITAPTGVNPGGVYFINESTPAKQKYAPRISIKTGGESYPIYYSGKTDAATFKKELAAYNDKIKQLNTNGNLVVPNLASTVTEHVFTVGKATDAYNSFVKGTTDPQASADAWEDMMLYDYKLLGYSKNAKDPKHQVPENRLIVRAVTDGMYAAGGFIGIGYDSEAILFGTDLGWGSYHEAGHVIEMGPLRFLELTNNIFSLANQERVGSSIRIETDDIFNDLFNHYTSGKTLGFSYQKRPDAEVTLGMWEAHMVMWQLRIAFGYDFYTDVFIAGRDTNFNAGSTAGDRWARLGSDRAGYDLGAYFHRMGMKISDETLAYTSKYKKLDIALQYADTNARLYKGNGFAAGYVSNIASVEKVSNGVKISVDNKGIENDIMGFEVYRNGELIGYTNKGSYLDKTVGDATKATYKIKAFDRKLKAATMSDAKEINLHAPIISANIPAVTLKLDQNYQPLEYVKAKTYDGQELSDQIKVVRNTVNTKQIGDYEIEYEVTDTKGNKQTYTLPVKVVPNFTYASDIDWKTITNTYGVTKKDKTISGKNITLTNGHGPIVYSKGLGTHATSTIIYDVTGKDYRIFESIIGVEQSVGANNDSSVVFEVYVDGQKKYDSGIMRFTTPQKLVQVDIEGAKEIKLVLSDGGNGIGSDHGAWANAKFISPEDKQQEVKDLQALLKFVEPITDISYVDPKLKHRQARLDNVIAYKATIENMLASKDTTKDAMNQATIMMTYFIEELGQTYKAGESAIVLEEKQSQAMKDLQNLQKFYQPINNLSYVNPKLKHQQARLDNFMSYKPEIEKLLTSKDATDTDLQNAYKMMIYFVGELGQTYQPNTQPVIFK